MSQQTLAEAAGLHRVAYAKYELGVHQPLVGAAVRIANALDTTVEELWPIETTIERERPMTYQATQRVRITTKDGKNPAPCTHEDRGDGTPMCGTPARTWRGQPLVYTPRGSGDVDCQLCARTHRA